MEVYAHYLKDKNGDEISPIISNSTIYDENGNNYSDTGWQTILPLTTDTDYSTFLTYVNSSQSSYTKNCWRVINGVLYLQIGVGNSSNSTFNTTTETTFAQVPIGLAWAVGSSNNIYSPTVGTTGELGPRY